MRFAVSQPLLSAYRQQNASFHPAYARGGKLTEQKALGWFCVRTSSLLTWPLTSTRTHRPTIGWPTAARRWPTEAPAAALLTQESPLLPRWEPAAGQWAHQETQAPGTFPGHPLLPLHYGTCQPAPTKASFPSQTTVSSTEKSSKNWTLVKSISNKHQPFHQ